MPIAVCNHCPNYYLTKIWNNEQLYLNSVGGENTEGVLKSSSLRHCPHTAAVTCVCLHDGCRPIRGQGCELCDQWEARDATNDTSHTRTAFHYTCSLIEREEAVGEGVMCIYSDICALVIMISEGECVHVCSLSESQSYWYWSIGTLQRDLVSAFTLWINNWTNNFLRTTGTCDLNCVHLSISHCFAELGQHHKESSR